MAEVVQFICEKHGNPYKTNIFSRSTKIYKRLCKTDFSEGPAGVSASKGLVEWNGGDTQNPHMASGRCDLRYVYLYGARIPVPVTHDANTSANNMEMLGKQTLFHETKYYCAKKNHGDETHAPWTGAVIIVYRNRKRCAAQAMP